jgi:hypothetical protein
MDATNTDMDIKRRHYQKRTVLYTIGMCWGSVSFGFGSAIIATTLGESDSLAMGSYHVAENNKASLPSTNTWTLSTTPVSHPSLEP